MTTSETYTPKKSPVIGLKQMLKLILSLLIVTVVAALILSLVNTLTADTIAKRNEEARREAMSCVLPHAEHFSDLYNVDPAIDRITGGYIGINLVGYCVEVAPNGFGGAIRLMVGVDSNGSVTGVTILDHSETAGLGAKAENPSFLDQYVGKTDTIHVNTGNNAVEPANTHRRKRRAPGRNFALHKIIAVKKYLF